jgi:hypothetical protein
MNDQSQQPSGGSLWLTVIVVIGCFLLFVGMLYKWYLPLRPTGEAVAPVFSKAEMAELDKLAPAEREAKLSALRWERRLPTPAERKARLVEIREKDAAALAGYSWVDKDQGIVRLPIDRAIELTVQDLQRASRNR